MELWMQWSCLNSLFFGHMPMAVPRSFLAAERHRCLISNWAAKIQICARNVTLESPRSPDDQVAITKRAQLVQDCLTQSCTAAPGKC